jgi:hypothetical protein
MPRALLAVAAGLAALALLAAPAAAQTCSCTTYQSAKQFVQFNDAIFKGTVVSSKSEYGSTTTQFQVLETLKGELGTQTAVMHPAPGKCGGVAFKPGQTVMIVAQGMMEDLATTSCQISAYDEAQIRAALK